MADDDLNNQAADDNLQQDTQPVEEQASQSDSNETEEVENTNPVEEVEETQDEKLEAGDSKLDEEAGSLKMEDNPDSSIQSPEPASSDQPQASEEDSTDSTEETSSAEEAAALEEDTDDNPDAKWYVVHTYSGHENKVATALKQRVESEHLENMILDVIVPTQDKIEIRGGKKAEVKEKIFPGYILVKMVMDDNSWLAVRTTQGVTGFIGMGQKPTPIPASEVKTIVRFMTQGAAPTFKDVFLVDDTVKIVDGPFSEFIGKVDSVDKDKGKVRVLVSIFGRETPVELDFLQVQKL